MAAKALRDQFPLRLIIGQEDCTFLLDSGFTFSSVDPGGFEACSFIIPKDMPETLRGMYIRMDCGLKVAWEGRVAEVQRSLGNQTTITGEGNGALLKDQAASMVFVDRDLTRWADPSVARQVALVGGNYQLGTVEVAADPVNNLPALTEIITDSWVSPYVPICEAWYDAGPLNAIYTIYYDAIQTQAGGAWEAYLYGAADTSLGTASNSSNLSTTSGLSGYYTPSSRWRYAMAQWLYSLTPAGAQGDQFNGFWHNLAVYGNHGLAGQGSDPVGYYPSQIAQWCAQQCPGLQLGMIPSTDATGYIMPHAVYYDPVGLDQIVNDMATAAGWHWGVWEAPSPLTGLALPRFDFRPRPAQGTYTASCQRADTDTSDIREDLAGMYNEAVISYTNVDGTDGAVVVTADNPILDQVGLSRTVELNGGTMTPAAAAVFGAMALDLLYTQGRVSGSVTITTAINSLSGPMPAWLLKPGIDRLRIVDLPSVDAFGAYNDLPLTRMECSGSTSGFSTSLEVGAGADLVETLQARLTAASVLAAQGG